MTATNSHPFANPLNQSRFRNFSFGQSKINDNPYVMDQSSKSNSLDPSQLTVPNPTSYEEILHKQNAVKQLEVPNSDIPYYDRPIPANGFLGKSSLFKLLDGSIIDMKEGKIVYDPNIKWKARGYWNDPNFKIEKHEAEWGKTETIESLLNNIGKPTDMNNDPNLSPESIKYWKKAQDESKKLEQNLTDEQKNLLDALNSGKIFPLAKLVEET